MNKRNTARYAFVFIGSVALAYLFMANVDINPRHRVGDVIDEFNGVKIFYNGAINNTTERNLSPDGYNIGLKYQCVEFVKRYYYEHLGHKMPESRGHAKDFFDPKIKHGDLNPARGLYQYRNPGDVKPEVNDLVVLRPWLFNRYGHVAIISKASDKEIEVVQQNPGPFGNSRETFSLAFKEGKWIVQNDRLLGWMRLDLERTAPSVIQTPKAALGTNQRQP